MRICPKCGGNVVRRCGLPQQQQEAQLDYYCVSCAAALPDLLPVDNAIERVTAAYNKLRAGRDQSIRFVDRPPGELACAAACLAVAREEGLSVVRAQPARGGLLWAWPDSAALWIADTRDPLDNLVEAGALIAAEIDRLLIERARAATAAPPEVPR